VICAICLRLGRPLVDDLDGDWARPAITVANGTAYCSEHLDELHDWQSEVHGPLSLLAQVDVLLRIVEQARPDEATTAPEDGPDRAR
jgi:hypothetical protein